jgi:hypothetical protein
MWKKIKEEALFAYGVSIMVVMEGVQRADNAISDWRSSDNGVTPDVASTKRISIAGLEKDISIPAPTNEDKKWARKMKKADSNTVQDELCAAIEKGNNWRALYLINRPYRNLHVMDHATRGFSGNIRLEEAMHRAAKSDNAAAAYILLKYAEKHPTHISAADDKIHDWMRDHEANAVAFHGLRSAAQLGADKMVTLFANTIGDFGKAYDRSPGNECFDHYLVGCVNDVITNRKTNQLDILLQKGVTADTFRQGFERTFGAPESTSRQKAVAPEDWAIFTEWALRKGVIDQAYASTIPMREMVEADAIAAAKANGCHYEPLWPIHRHFGAYGGDRTKQVDMAFARIDEERVESEKYAKYAFSRPLTSASGVGP